MSAIAANSNKRIDAVNRITSTSDATHSPFAEQTQLIDLVKMTISAISCLLGAMWKLFCAMFPIQFW
ncbi:MAG: hypothetical protein ACQJCO_08965 [cyanobacterium endosymbiont of Rhopalodia sterrenbergii]